MGDATQWVTTFTWQMAERKAWPCRWLLHRHCRGSWRVRAVTYVGDKASDRRDVAAYIACPCSCHGILL